MFSVHIGAIEECIECKYNKRWRNEGVKGKLSGEMRPNRRLNIIKCVILVWNALWLMQCKMSYGVYLSKTANSYLKEINLRRGKVKVQKVKQFKISQRDLFKAQ